MRFNMCILRNKSKPPDVQFVSATSRKINKYKKFHRTVLVCGKHIGSALKKTGKLRTSTEDSTCITRYFKAYCAFYGTKGHTRQKFRGHART